MTRPSMWLTPVCWAIVLMGLAGAIVLNCIEPMIWRP